jgi:hypothetical protein
MSEDRMTKEEIVQNPFHHPLNHLPTTTRRWHSPVTATGVPHQPNPDIGAGDAPPLTPTGTGDPPPVHSAAALRQGVLGHDGLLPAQSPAIR